MDTSKFYEADFRLPACSVDKKLLEEVESFFERKDREYCSSETGLFSDRFCIRVCDSRGVEQCASIKSFAPSRFPNDTTKILASYSWRSGGPFKAEVVFALNRDDSEIKLYYCGDNPRHTVYGAHAELMQLLSSHETGFGYAHLPRWGSVTALCIASVVGGISLAQVFSGKASTWTIGVGAGMLGALYAIALPGLRPYSRFDNSKNASKDKWAFWAMSSGLAFVVFGVMGVIFRKKLLGY